MRNPLRPMLPLIRVAASSIVGPFGFLVAPALAAVAIRLGEMLSHDDSGIETAASDVLNHILGHLSGDATKEFFDSLGELHNHDLTRVTVAALREGLSFAHSSIAPPDRILVDRFDAWFALWDRRLDRALKSEDNSIGLFYSEAEVDAIALASLEDDQIWPVCEVLLLRWATDQQAFEGSRLVDTSTLPDELHGYLSDRFIEMSRHGMSLVLRDRSQRRGWIAWQQRFLEAVANETRKSNRRVAEHLDLLIKNSSLMNSWLQEQFSDLNNRLEAIYEMLRSDILRRETEMIEGLAPTARLRIIQRAVRMRVERSGRTASTILIAGMSKPLPLDDVYRVLHVGRSEFDVNSSVTVDDLITGMKSSAILLAPPGRGKTSTLQHAYHLLSRKPAVLTLLYLLKDDRSLREVYEVIHSIRDNGVDSLTNGTVVLLLDGYDEIDYDERARLSSALNEVSYNNRFYFILTCRTYYEIISLPVDRYYLLPFTEADALAFLSCFLRHDREGKFVPDSDAKASELLALMKRRGFDDFLHTPLFLAFTAILQTGDKPKVPRNAIRLLRAVVYYLTSQWDKERGVHREGLVVDRGIGRPDFINVEGEDLLTCMKRIAVAFENIEGSAIIAEREAREHLAAMQIEKLTPQTFLLEIARWFGLLVPSLSGEWSFVHRAVHEYLAATLMVETGQFTLDKARRNWRRAHFAACLVPDASEYIAKALQSGDELEMFVECCSNDAYFSPINVAHALIAFYESPKESCSFRYDAAGHSVAVELHQDYLDVVKTPFLRQWVYLAARRGGFHRGALISLALALSELRNRREPYDGMPDLYPFSGFQWEVTRVGVGGTVHFNIAGSAPSNQPENEDSRGAHG